MVWSWVTLLEYRLDHHFLAEGHGWNCPDSPTRGLKQCGTSKVCGSGVRSGETPGFGVGGSPPWEGRGAGRGSP